MAEDESLLDKAVAMLPAVIAPAPKKRGRKKPQSFSQKLAEVRRNLARLTQDVEKLAAGMIADARKRIAPAKKAPKRRAAKRTTARKASTRKAPPRKK
jgi:hypothetical protein